MTFDQAMTTTRPQFSQVLNSMTHEALEVLCKEFEQKLDSRLLSEYNHKFANEDNSFKAVLLGKITFMYFVLKTSVKV